MKFMLSAKILLFKYVETRKTNTKILIFIKCMYTIFFAPINNYERPLSHNTRRSSSAVATTVVCLEKKLLYPG